jgi:two-component system osmolarity sensor histidine kinase EnvZ
LFDLASNEGIRIYPLEATDRIEPPLDSALMPNLQMSVRAKLGNDTKFASMVNDIPGFWISFKIEDDDEYWLMLERNRFERVSGLQWLGWATLVLVMSLMGAAFISRLINQPLARLAFAAKSMARGEPPPPLPETGPVEVREANGSFNQMVMDLERVDSDRAFILAGISHDLRTPLARMQLELEMANLTEQERNGMQSDIQQMDAIIGQFLDYAKPADSAGFIPINLTPMLAEAAQEAGRLPAMHVSVDLDEDVSVNGNATELQRVINNLLENARRYGRSEGSGIADVEISCHRSGSEILVEIADHGPGVPEDDRERLLHPFTQLDTARGQANGAGLGLAIVNRVIKRHGGRLRLKNRESGGLIVSIVLPLASA